MPASDSSSGVKIFNTAGVPIDVVQQVSSNEVKWTNADVNAGLYMYLMEVESGDGKMKQSGGVLEVRRCWRFVGRIPV